MTRNGSGKNRSGQRENDTSTSIGDGERGSVGDDGVQVKAASTKKKGKVKAVSTKKKRKVKAVSTKKVGKRGKRTVVDAPAKVASMKKKEKQSRRSVKTAPASCKQIKDFTATRQVKGFLKSFKTFQHRMTPQCGEDTPKLHLSIAVYDELIKRPDQLKSKGKSNNNDYFRYDKEGKKSPKLGFLVPEGVDELEFLSWMKKRIIERENSLKNECNSVEASEINSSEDSDSEDWTFTSDDQKFFRFVFGSKKFEEGDNEQKKRNNGT